MGTCIQSQASQVKRQSQCTEHQVRTARSISHHVHPRTECPDKNTYDDRASCQSEPHGSADTGNGNRNCSQSQTDDNADKYRHQVRFLQAFHSIAQHLLHILYGSGFAHYGQAVTQLQGQFRCGQQLHAATINPADIDTVMITQMERTQLLAVQLRARHHDTLRNQLAVYGIPVYIFLVPISMLLLAEKHSQSRRIFLRGNHQQAVTFLYNLFRGRNTHIPIPPQAGNHELRIAVQPAYFLDTLVEDGRIVHLERNNVRLVHVILLFQFQVFLMRQRLTDEQYGQNDPYHPQRICHRTPQSRGTGLQSHLFQCLLCRTECRCVCRGTAKYAHHIRQGYSQPIAAQYSQQGADKHYTRGEHIQLYPSFTERAEKTRSHLQTQSIHKYHQPEAFRIIQHLRVYGQPEMPGNDAGKEYKRHSQ